MAVNEGFREFVLEQFGRHVSGVRARAMFGGVAISASAGTFALIDDDVVYLKGDATSRVHYASAGWPPFRPFGEEGGAMAYFAVPGEMLEDVEALVPWLELALDAARRAPKKKPRKGRRT